MNKLVTIGERYHYLKKQIDSVASSKVTLIAVSKNHSIDKVLEAREAGCFDFGENRLQEALSKIEEAPKDIRWHFIGSLQKNKVRKVVGRFYLIHSVDRLDLAQKISDVSLEMGVVSNILLQVNISGEKSKQGMKKKELSDNLSSLIEMKGIHLQGLMTMAPLTDDTSVIRSCFSGLREFRDELKIRSKEALSLQHLSMGMSGDYLIAIDEGASFVRIGSILFGKKM